MERLTVALPDGAIATLRQLAKGERKVGAYLSNVVTWLADAQRQQVLAETPLSECVLVTKARVTGVDGQLQYFEESLTQLQRQLVQVQAHVDRLSAQQQQPSQNDA